jgi:hypothetical protein
LLLFLSFLVDGLARYSSTARLSLFIFLSFLSFLSFRSFFFGRWQLVARGVRTWEGGGCHALGKVRTIRPEATSA